MVDATAAATANSTVAALPAPTLRLAIDTKAKRVLYAEADKEAVDFLFSIIATPMGTLFKLLRDDGGQATGAANMYDSAEKMKPAYMKSAAVQDALLNSHRHSLLQHPTIRLNHWPWSTVPASTALTYVHGGTTTTQMYASAVTAPTSVARCCPSGGCAGGGCSSGGFVQDLVTYTVMDDLTIAPSASVTLMGLLSKLNGEEKGLVVEEKSVQLGVQEGLDILKAYLQSNTVLTDVFLSNSTTDDVPQSKSKKARTSSGKNNALQEKVDKIPDYFL